MPLTFWGGYLEKLTILALLLSLLYVLARRLRVGRVFPRRARQIIVLESAMLSAHGTLHVVRAGDRCFLIGSTAAGLTTLAELRCIEGEN